MPTRLLPVLALCAAAVSPALVAAPAPATARRAAPQVQIDTSLGNFVVQLDPQKAPVTVRNFLDYVQSGFYNGTIFHRIVPGFVIQGGGYTQDYRAKKTNPPIKDEADNGLSNLRGTIAMARKMAPDSATSQFYINLSDNSTLDYGGPDQPGYAVFGRVVEGMDVIAKIAAVPTGPAGPFPRDAPQSPVVIEKAFVLKP